MVVTEVEVIERWVVELQTQRGEVESLYRFSEAPTF
jgi:hypothetical protein